jgi:hypothetical protein
MHRTVIVYAAAVVLSGQPVLAGQHGHTGTPKPQTHPTTAHPQPTSTSHAPAPHSGTSHANTTHGTTTHGSSTHATTHGSPHASPTTQASHGGHGPATPKTKTTKAPTPTSTTSAKSSKSTNHGATAKNSKNSTTSTTTGASGSTSTTTPGTGTGTAVTLTPVQQKLQKNTNLASKLQGRLPAGTDLMTASSGFRNLGQFVAAVNVSNNLGIPFAQLKTRMVDDGMSLGQSIQALKPTANSTVEAGRAEHDADVLIQATVTTTSSTSTTTTAPTTKKSKKTTSGS